MKIWQGSNGKELVNRLKELESLTSIDSILHPAEKVTVTATAYGSGLKRWTVETDGVETLAGVVNGNKFDRFLSMIEEAEAEADLGIYGTQVLAYADMRPHRTYDGKLLTKWYCIDPLMPFEVDLETRQPVFRFEELEVTETEYRMLMETKLAIKSDGMVYALLRDALSSAGRLLLDASAAFRRSEDVPLCCGMLLADALADRDSLKALTRNTGGNVRQILVLMGDRYTYISQNVFFEEVFRHVAAFGMYRIRHWTIGAMQTCVEIVLPEENGCRKGFLVTASDYNGIPMKVATFGEFQDGSKVVLCQTSMTHSKSSAAEGVKRLFNGAAGAFADFDSFIEDMSGMDVRFEMSCYDGQLSGIRKLIGQRRFNIPEKVEGTGLNIAMMLAGTLDADIRDRNELRSLVWKLLLDLRDDSLDSAVSARF